MKLARACSSSAALRRRLCLGLLLLWPALSPVALAQREAAEYELKAAFLYNFAAYVEWPEGAFSGPTAPFVFGVVGADRLAEDLELMALDRQAQGREIQVRRLRPDASVQGLHMLFVEESWRRRAEGLLREAADGAVLTVTESANARSTSSMINFLILDSRMRFDVSLPLAQAAGLDISARLLQIALQVLE